MAKKEETYNSDKAIEELVKMYPVELLRGLVDSKRYDLIMGLAFGKKGAVIDEDGRITFMKKVLVEIEESELSKYTEAEVAWREKKEDGRVVCYREVQKEYTDKETKLITGIYNSSIRERNVTPNLNWASMVDEFVSKEYIEKLNVAQKELLEFGKGWDFIGFADRVPLADVATLEDKVIETGDSLKILAFASDVKRANLKKLQKALEKIGNTRTEDLGLDSEGKTIVREIDHISIFKDRFADKLNSEESEN